MPAGGNFFNWNMPKCIRDFGSFKDEIKVDILRRKIEITTYWKVDNNTWYSIPDRDRKVIKYGLLTFLKILLLRKYKESEYLLRVLFK